MKGTGSLRNQSPNWSGEDYVVSSNPVKASALQSPPADTEELLMSHSLPPAEAHSQPAIQGIPTINYPGIWDSKAWRSCRAERSRAGTDAGTSGMLFHHPAPPTAGGCRFPGDSGWEFGSRDHRTKQSRVSRGAGGCEGTARSGSGDGEGHRSCQNSLQLCSVRIDQHCENVLMLGSLVPMGLIPCSEDRAESRGMQSPMDGVQGGAGRAASRWKRGGRCFLPRPGMFS